MKSSFEGELKIEKGKVLKHRTDNNRTLKENISNINKFGGYALFVLDRSEYIQWGTKGRKSIFCIKGISFMIFLTTFESEHKYLSVCILKLYTTLFKLLYII